MTAFGDREQRPCTVRAAPSFPCVLLDDIFILWLHDHGQVLSLSFLSYKTGIITDLPHRLVVKIKCLVMVFAGIFQQMKTRNK